MARLRMPARESATRAMAGMATGGRDQPLSDSAGSASSGRRETSGRDAPAKAGHGDRRPRSR